MWGRAPSPVQAEQSSAAATGDSSGFATGALGVLHCPIRKSVSTISSWITVDFSSAAVAARFGWKAWQFKYLNRLWAIESGWDRYASNPYSGAYGIPQAVPGSKMSSAGPGWQWNARTQIRWGMRYIQARYRTPYWAWRQQHAYGWY